MREEAISVGLWPWPVEAAYSRRTNHQFTLVVLIIFGIPLHSFAKKGVTNRPYFKKRIEKRIQHLSHPKNNLFSTEDMGFEPTHAITRLPRFQHGLLSLLSNLPILTQIVYHKGSYLAIKILEIRKNDRF